MDRNAMGLELWKERARLAAFAYKLGCSREDAEDLVMTTITKCMESHAQYTPGTNLMAWAMTVLRNKRLSDLRRAHRLQFYDPQPNEDGWVAFAERAGPDDPEKVLEFHRAVAALQFLPDDQIAAVLLTGYMGYTFDDAAKSQGVCAGTMKSRASRGRRDLKLACGYG